MEMRYRVRFASSSVRRVSCWSNDPWRCRRCAVGHFSSAMTRQKSCKDTPRLQVSGKTLLPHTCTIWSPSKRIIPTDKYGDMSRYHFYLPQVISLQMLENVLLLKASPLVWSAGKMAKIRPAANGDFARNNSQRKVEFFDSLKRDGVFLRTDQR